MRYTAARTAGWKRTRWAFGLAGLSGLAPMIVIAQPNTTHTMDRQPDTSALSEVADRSTTLTPIEVEGQRLDADTPIQGYTAYTSRGASKTDTPLIETPQTVDVITRDQLEDQGSRTINDALRYTPGAFTGLAGASTRQDVVALRGFHGGDVDNMFLDGLRLMSDAGSYSNIQIDPFFLERIDVVKGPSSVLYGRAMPGGLVNYTAKQPRDEQQGLVRVFGGSDTTVGGGVDLTGPLPNISWAQYRLVAKGEKSDTQYDVVERERYTIMPEVSLDLADDTTLRLQAYIQHEPEGGFHGAVPYDISVDGSAYGRTVDPSWVDVARDNANFERDERLVSYQLDHQFNDDISLHSRARYADVEVDLDQVYQIGFTAATDDGATLNRYYSGASEHLKALSIDNYAQLDFNTGALEHQLVAGFGYQQRTNHVQNFGAPGTPLDAFDTDYSGDGLAATPAMSIDTDRKLKQYGIYLQDQLSLRRWHVMLSGRQDYLERDYLSAIRNARDTRDDDAFSGRAALLYHAKWGLSPYFSYSEAFNPSTDTSVDGVVPEPEDSNQYEIGVKYQPDGIDALFTLALYDLTQNNVQQRATVTPITYNSVGDIQSRGVEFTAKANLTDKWHIVAGYSYSDTEYQDTFTDPSGNDVSAGNTPVLSPDQLASLWVKYDFPKGIEAGLGGRYVGESYANSRNTLKVPDYAVMDAFVGIELGEFVARAEGVSVRVNANNLLDKAYVQGCFSPTYCYFGKTRQVTATLDYRF